MGQKQQPAPPPIPEPKQYISITPQKSFENLSAAGQAYTDQLNQLMGLMASTGRTPAQIGLGQAQTRTQAAGNYLASLPTGDKYLHRTTGRELDPSEYTQREAIRGQFSEKASERKLAKDLAKKEFDSYREYAPYKAARGAAETNLRYEEDELARAYARRHDQPEPFVWGKKPWEEQEMPVPYEITVKNPEEETKAEQESKEESPKKGAKLFLDSYLNF